MRYVILEHRQIDSVHWDLMLARPAALLRTWALADRPSAAGWRRARELPDHREIYLRYQGPISGSRGWVTRWDEGHYRLCEETRDTVRILVNGRRLCGCWEFQRDPAAEDAWRCQLNWRWGRSRAEG